MAQTSVKELTGRQKAAILLISLGPEISAKVFHHLREEEIESISLEIASQRQISPDIREKVLYEFYQIHQAQQYISQGGIDYAKEILERALGSNKAMEILQRLTASLQVRPFSFVRKADPNQLISFIQGEHPQTVALIMAYLQPEQASVVLAALPPERQADVARRMAIMDRTSPEVLKEVERVLERKLSALVTQESTTAGGLGWAVDVLNRVDRSTERGIMETLGRSDPDLAGEIKQRMFLFDDVVKLDDRSVQRILRDVDMNKDLPMALKGAKEEVWKKILNNLSKRAGETLRESVEYLGPVRIRDVEEAQTKIVNVIRGLEEKGELQITRGGSEDEFI